MNMMTELATAYPGLMGGMITTLKVLFLAIIGGISLGTVLALMRLSGIKALEIPAKLYIELFSFCTATTGATVVLLCRTDDLFLDSG